jgi:hypothetical protein
MYAYKTGSPQNSGDDVLSIGALDGGRPAIIAADGIGGINRSAVLSIVGWTTF